MKSVRSNSDFVYFNLPAKLGKAKGCLSEALVKNWFLKAFKPF